MKIGLVGKPSVGKSTLFQAITNIPVPRAPYPFTTIEPNEGVGYVRVDCVCKEFGVSCNPREGFCVNGQRFVPVLLMDVAGLVPGAHEGKGLGNAFLDDLRQADALILVVDCSGRTNEKGEATQDYDPCKDVYFLLEELDFWMLSILNKHWKKLIRKNQTQDAKQILSELFSGLKFSQDDVDVALRALKLDECPLMQWNEEQKIEFVKRLRASKPMVIAANKMDLPSSSKNLERLRTSFPNIPIVPVSAEMELVLKTASKKRFIDYVPGDADFKILKQVNEQQDKALKMVREFINGNSGTGVQRLLDTLVFDLMGYVAVFPGGVKNLQDEQGRILPDCFLMPPNSTARDFAFRIHSDLGKGFIKAIDVRTKRALGADYILRHRDVVEIVYR